MTEKAGYTKKYRIVFLDPKSKKRKILFLQKPP